MLVENPKIKKKSKDMIEFGRTAQTVKSVPSNPKVIYREAYFSERLLAVLINFLFLILFVNLFEFFVEDYAKIFSLSTYVLFQLVLMKIWGKTLGKKIMKIHVSFRNEEEKLSFGYYIVREFRAFFHFFIYVSSIIFYIFLVLKLIIKVINVLRGKEKMTLNSLIDTDDIVVLKEIQAK